VKPTVVYAKQEVSELSSSCENINPGGPMLVANPWSHPRG
jgi:hypothetical protein